MNHGDMDIVQAESLPADLAMEMAVQLLDPTCVIVVTEAILRGAAAVLDDMQQMVLGKESQRSEDRGFVERIGFRFEVGETERMLEAFHDFEQEDTDGRRTNTVLQKNCFTVAAVHFVQKSDRMQPVIQRKQGRDTKRGKAPFRPRHSGASKGFGAARNATPEPAGLSTPGSTEQRPAEAAVCAGFRFRMRQQKRGAERIRPPSRAGAPRRCNGRISRCRRSATPCRD